MAEIRNNKFWIKLLVGAILSLLTILLGWTFIAQKMLAENVITNDKESRSRDSGIIEKIGEMKDEQNDKLDDIRKEQTTMKLEQQKGFSDIMMAVTKVQAQLEAHD